MDVVTSVDEEIPRKHSNRGDVRVSLKKSLEKQKWMNLVGIISAFKFWKIS